MTTEVKVRQIIIEQLGVDGDEVTRDSRFHEDLGADSLDAVEITLAIEEAFDVEVPDDDLEKLNTVGKLIDYIDQ